MRHTINCRNCNSLFAQRSHFQAFCSKECNEDYSGPRAFNLKQQTCGQCGAIFMQNVPSQKFCGSLCRDESRKPAIKSGPRGVIDTVCDACGKIFPSKSKTHRFCCQECRESLRKPPVTVTKSCEYCKKQYETYILNQRFCGESCRKSALDEKKKSKTATNSNCVRKTNRAKIKREESDSKKSLKKVSYQCGIDINKTWVDSIGLNLWNESQFVEWFKNNHLMFGVKKIIKLDVFFPDCIAEMVDGRTLNIELEYEARNFELHKHDPKICDLIISYKKKPNCEDVLGVPVLSMFDYSKKINGDEIRTVTPYLQWLTSITGKAVGMIVNRNPR